LINQKSMIGTDEERRSSNAEINKLYIYIYFDDMCGSVHLALV